jgi:cob(I)alamin adenosyltransferase
MKIYTGTGDSGTTGIFGGNRVAKHHPRIEAYGTVDELNAAIGMVLGHQTSSDTLGPAADMLKRIQSELFVVGADLATPMDARVDVPRVEERMVRQLEADIDGTDDGLDELKSFILPGGIPVAASLHFARTVCRRAERRVVQFGESAEINEKTVVYLNRLADLLFVMARHANTSSGSGDVIWKSE